MHHFSEKKIIEQAPVTFLAPTRPAAHSKAPPQPPAHHITGTDKVRTSSPQVIECNRNPYEEEELAHDEDFSFGVLRKETNGGKEKCGGRPSGRNVAACVTDVLLLASCAMFLQEANRVSRISNKVSSDNHSLACYISAGVCEGISLICALIVNFRKKHTFMPFIGTICSIGGTVAGFCAGILSDYLGETVLPILVSFFAFCGFFTFGVIVDGGMSLRRPPPAGAAYK